MLFALIIMMMILIMIVVVIMMIMAEVITLYFLSDWTILPKFNIQSMLPMSVY